MIVGLDTETYTIDDDRRIPTLVCVTVCTGDRQELWTGQAMLQLRSLSADRDVVFVAHNAVFDVLALVEAGVWTLDTALRLVDEDRIRCTKLREELIWIAAGRRPPRGADGSGPHSLSACVQRRGGSLSGKQGADVWRLRYHELHGRPVADWPVAAKEYALRDASAHRDLYLWQKQEMQGERVRNEQTQVRAGIVLALMGARGIRVDPVARAAFRSRVLAEQREAQRVARELGILRPNGKRNARALEDLVSQAYGSRAPLTPTGRVQTSRDVLLQSGDARLVQYAQATATSKEATTYLPVLERRTVHSSPRTLLKTGRASWPGTLLMNPPRTPGFRECLVPRPGFAFVAADYSTVELCALAQIHLWEGWDSSMADAINAGRDCHLWMAAAVLRTPYHLAQQALEQGDCDVKRVRNLSKIANFGFAGGLSARSFVSYARGYGVTVTEDEALYLRRKWFAAWPAMRSYFEKIGAETSGGPGVVTQYRSRRRRGGCSFTEAANSYFQGLVADGAKAALWLIQRACVSGELRGSYPVLFIHDEVVLETPLDKVHEHSEHLCRLMLDGMRAYIPDVAIRAEPVAMMRWSKSAEELRDSDGRLVPWRPS